MMRHVLYLAVCWSIIRDVSTLMPYGCYRADTGALVSPDGGSSIFANILQPFNDPSGLVCFNPQIRWGFLALLGALQVLTIIWFCMILRVAYGVISGRASEDPRSEDEDECDEVEDPADYDLDDKLAHLEEAHPGAEVDPIEVEVGGDDVTGAFANRAGSPTARTRSQKRSARASAISIPGHGDHKELLGRIGCDKPT